MGGIADASTRFEALLWEFEGQAQGLKLCCGSLKAMHGLAGLDQRKNTRTTRHTNIVQTLSLALIVRGTRDCDEIQR